MLALYISLGVVAFLIILFFIVTYFSYRVSFYNDAKYGDHFEPVKGPQVDPYHDLMKKMIKEASLIPISKEVDIKAFDKLNLHGNLYIQNEAYPWCIQVHGYKGIGFRDFSGGLKEFLARGYNVLQIDQRGHGKSGGRTITFGVKEHKDVMSWISYINKEYNNPPIILYGISMGGNTVCLNSGDNLPSNVKGIIADCPYTSVKDITCNTAFNAGKLSPKITKLLLTPAARIYGHFSYLDGDAREAVKKSKTPILIISGDEDRLVPPYMPKAIKDANPEMIRLVFIKGAPHGLSYIIDNKTVLEEVTNFLNRVM